MNLTDELRAVKSGEKDLRNFGFLLGGVLAGISFFPVLMGRGVSSPWLLVGITLIFRSIPRSACPAGAIGTAARLLPERAALKSSFNIDRIKATFGMTRV